MDVVLESIPVEFFFDDSLLSCLSESQRWLIQELDQLFDFTVNTTKTFIELASDNFCVMIDKEGNFVSATNYSLPIYKNYIVCKQIDINTLESIKELYKTNKM